jgi:hypothetical protein
MHWQPILASVSILQFQKRLRMRTVKMFLALMIVCLTATQVNAQGNNGYGSANGELNIAHVEVVEYAPNQAYITIKLVGQLAPDITEVSYTITGARIPGGQYQVLLDQSRYAIPDPEWQVNFSILPNNTNGNGGQVNEVEIEFSAGPGYRGPKTKIARRFKEPIFAPSR